MGVRASLQNWVPFMKDCEKSPKKRAMKKLYALIRVLQEAIKEA
jgi:hypothetical protein